MTSSEPSSPPTPTATAWTLDDLYQPVIRAALHDALRHKITLDDLYATVLHWTDRAEQSEMRKRL